MSSDSRLVKIGKSFLATLAAIVAVNTVFNGLAIFGAHEAIHDCERERKGIKREIRSVCDYCSARHWSYVQGLYKIDELIAKEGMVREEEEFYRAERRRFVRNLYFAGYFFK